MKPVTLLLATTEGDELGRLPLPDVVVAGPDEIEAARRPRLDQEMADLNDRIRSAIRQEGMEPALNPIDFRIAISRALLELPEGEEILIPIPVREAPVEAEEPEADASGDLLDPEPSLLAGLFDLHLDNGEVPDA
jgi:hypothetical protein